MTIRLLFNILAIAGAGLFTGVMLNIGLAFGAWWKSLEPASFLDWFAANSNLIGRTIPLVVAPTVLGVAGSLWLGWSQPAARLARLLALASILALLTITAVYHLPTNGAFAAKAVPLDQVAATLDRWLLLHWARIALGLIATVAGIVAIGR